MADQQRSRVPRYQVVRRVARVVVDALPPAWDVLAVMGLGMLLAGLWSRLGWDLACIVVGPLVLVLAIAGGRAAAQAETATDAVDGREG